MQANETAQDLDRAVQVILDGQVLIYPSETLYALGCNAFDPVAVAKVATCKGREANKPLPLIIGGMHQLRQMSPELQPEVAELAVRFWPGPLSLLLPALSTLPAQVQDTTGWVSVRWTPHPVAQALCSRAGVPLVATSANMAGEQAVARPENLDPHLRAAVDHVCLAPPWPAGGLPSTVVRIQGPARLALLREGAVSIHRLQAAGWKVER